MSRHETMGRNTQLASRRGSEIGIVSPATNALVPTLSSPPEPTWLLAWQAAEPLPVSVAAAMEALTSFEGLTAASTSEDIRAALAPAIEFFGPPTAWEHKAAIYATLLCDIPADLLAFGVWVAMREPPGEFFPQPGRIRALVADELARRHRVRNRLMWAVTASRLREQQRNRRSA